MIYDVLVVLSITLSIIALIVSIAQGIYTFWENRQ